MGPVGLVADSPGFLVGVQARAQQHTDAPRYHRTVVEGVAEPPCLSGRIGRGAAAVEDEPVAHISHHRAFLGFGGSPELALEAPLVCYT